MTEKDREGGDHTTSAPGFPGFLRHQSEGQNRTSQSEKRHADAKGYQLAVFLILV